MRSPARALVALALGAVLAAGASAAASGVADAQTAAKTSKKPAKAKAKAKERYHFVLRELKPIGIDAEAAADALRLLEAEIHKTFAGHEQLAVDVSGAPDPEADPKGYRKFLDKKKIKAAYRVDVDLVFYREEIEDAPEGAGKDAKRVVVRMEIKMFGEQIPDRRMAFEGRGSSTVKQDVGKKVRPKDREFTIQSAVELAVEDAIRTSMIELAKPPPKPSKK